MGLSQRGLRPQSKVESPKSKVAGQNLRAPRRFPNLVEQKKRTIAVAVDADTGSLLDIAARERGISRAEFIRRQLRRGLEQFREHPRPRSAGIIKSALAERGDEAELFRDIER